MDDVPPADLTLLARSPMMRAMRVTFLGTATSHGIPMIGCDCAVCRSPDPRNQRLRPSVYVESAGAKVLVDATPDLRTQALRANLRQVDAVLLTHTHADHMLGLDDLRAFTRETGRKLPVFGSAESLGDIQRMFPYACTATPPWPGLPSFDLRTVSPFREFGIGDLEILPLPLPHARMMVYGFVFNRELAYVTDCHAVPPAVVDRLRGVTVLVLDALRHRPHVAHLTIAQAVAVAAQVQPQLTLLTHLCHEVEHAAAEAELPATVRIAYDGMRVEVTSRDWKIV